jgi:hypothetical protein
VKVNTVEYVFTKVSPKKWTVGIVEDGQQIELSVEQFNRWQQDVVAHGLQVVWTDNEMTFQMYGRYFDVPIEVLEDYKI